jgi:hypothetical protein
MNLSGGWVQIRRGLLQHLHDGRLTPGEFTAMVLMILLADSDTGIWTGCSEGLSYVSGRQVSAKAAKDALRSLEAKGYILRDRTQGQRGIHPILLDKYLVTTGNLRGKRLTLAATTDCKRPQYEAVPDGVPHKQPDTVPETVPYTTNQESNKTRKIDSQIGSPSQFGQDKVKTNVDGVCEAEALTQFLCAEILRLPEPVAPATLKRMISEADTALASRPLDGLKQLLQFASTAPWWAQRLTAANYPMSFFVKSLDQIEEQYKAANRPKVNSKTSVPPRVTDHTNKPGVAEAMKFLTQKK